MSVTWGQFMVFQLVYVSYAQNGLTVDDVHEIAKQSAITNLDSNITGILLYADGNILQILEGHEEHIENLYSRIAEDERHSGVIVMLRKHTKSREFENWSMGFRAVEKSVYNDAVFILTKNSLEDSLPENRSLELDVMTRSFSRSIAI